MVRCLLSALPGRKSGITEVLQLFTDGGCVKPVGGYKISKQGIRGLTI